MTQTSDIPWDEWSITSYVSKNYSISIMENNANESNTPIGEQLSEVNGAHLTQIGAKSTLERLFNNEQANCAICNNVSHYYLNIGGEQRHLFASCACEKLGYSDSVNPRES